jgi:NTP pyrophosphatase (non-canonical NTP hydrolase)
MIKWEGIVKVMEESGELTTACAKLCACPNGVYWDGSDAITAVEDEMADIIAAIRFFCNTNGLRINHERVNEKLDKFNKWHSETNMQGIHIEG